MSAIEDPAAQLSNEATGAKQPSDDLEHWLSDLRTEVATDPSGWLDEGSASERPASQAVERNLLLHRQRPTSDSEPSSGGRHRAPD
jgi:hypothetical protein